MLDFPRAACQPSLFALAPGADGCLEAGGASLPREGFGDAADGLCPAAVLIDLNERPLQEHAAGRDAEALRGAGHEAFDDGIDLSAEHAFMRAGEAGIGQVGGAVGEDLFVRRLHVGVGSDHGADAAVEQAPHGNLLGGSLGVDVDKDDGGDLAEARNLALHGEERVLERWLHEGAALDVDHTHGRMSLAGEDGAALAGGAGRVVDGAHEAGFAIKELDDFLLVPKVIPAGDDVDACAVDIGRSLRSDSRTAGGVFAVGDHDINVERGAELGQETGYGTPAGLAHNITDEEEVHGSVTGRLGLIGFHADATAHEVAVAEDVVDPADGGPEFVTAQPWGGEGGLFAGVGAIPLVGDDGGGGVRSVFDDVVGLVDATAFDGEDFGVDADHGIAVTVELGFGFALGRLDHDGAAHGP